MILQEVEESTRNKLFVVGYRELLVFLVLVFLTGFLGFFLGAEAYRVYINLVVEQCASNSNIACNIPVVPW